MTCEDFPCCGHEAGCCPDFDASGRQTNMRCTCGAVVPLDNPYSICSECLNQGYMDEADSYEFEYEECEYDYEYLRDQPEDFGDWGEAGLWE